MIYLFDNTLCYCPEDGSICGLNAVDEEPIILTPILNRILLLLVERQGGLVTREDFLQKVWDDYGRTGSSNTLNQYMGTLRKIFSDKLLVELIITIPKQGYLLSPDVHIQSYASPGGHNSSDITNTDIISIDGGVVPHTEVHSVKMSASRKASYRYLPLIFALAGVGLIYLFLHDSAIKTFELTRLGSCPVYSFTDYSDREKKNNAINKVNKIVHSQDIACQVGNTFYFYSNRNGEEKKAGAYSILTRCSAKGSEDIGCSTYRTNRF